MNFRSQFRKYKLVTQPLSCYVHVLRIQLAENAQLRFGYVRKENVSCYYTMKMQKSSYAGKEGQTTL